MRRADRLFQIVQLLRGRRVVKAAEFAREFEVSLRTIYRDVADLIASGIPIEGEAGIGYCLSSAFDLPPLMFDEDELAALALGARMVQAWGDATLAKRAKSVLSKVETVLPERLKPRLSEIELYVPLRLPEAIRANTLVLRRGIDDKRKVHFEYTDQEGTVTERDVRPVCLVFWGTVWTVGAWCELRTDFRTFRPDRMEGLELLEERFEDEPGRDLATLLARVRGRAT